MTSRRAHHERKQLWRRVEIGSLLVMVTATVVLVGALLIR